MRPADATGLLKKFEVAFPGQRGGRESVEMYRDFLVKRDREVAEQAVDEIIESNVFWPSVAELKQAYDRAERASGGVDPRPLLKQAELLAHLRGYSLDEAKRDMLASFRKFAGDDPDNKGPWRHHIQTMEAM